MSDILCRDGTGSGLSPLNGFLGSPVMTIHLGNLAPIIALLAGILILLVPRMLNFIVAIYLIVVGILGLIH
jgi:DUF3096 family protein